MRRLWLYSFLLLLGLVASQFAWAIPHDLMIIFEPLLTLLAMTGLAYIMINVGREFSIEKTRIRAYGWDYIVAATAAAFPWIFTALYFMFVFYPASSWVDGSAWINTLLVSHFAAPTSAGVLFSMLAAAGHGSTWVFRKTRVLAIFDDLDTVLLIIPLKIVIVGFNWLLMSSIGIIIVQLSIAWIYLKRIRLRHTPGWILLYAAFLAFLSEGIYLMTEAWYKVPLHIEVLLPAFVLGCVMKDDDKEGHEEKGLDVVISALFMLLVGLSMPVIEWDAIGGEGSYSMVLFHVLMITILGNIGKMFPAFCYRNEASLRERLAVAIGMWPRGEVGAGVLILSLSYGIAGPIVGVASISLALNLALTGLFISAIHRLLKNEAKVVTG